MTGGKGKAKPSQSKELTKNLPARIEQLPAEQDPLATYLRQLKAYPPISREEELLLALAVYEKQDREAFKRLVQANLRFVVKLAFQYSRYGAKVMDLVQEGNVGLLKAVQEFNPHKDVRLLTYAVHWIRSYMQDYLLRNWSLVRVGTTKAQKKLFYNLKKAQERLEREGIAPETKAIAMDLNVDESDVKLMEQRMSGKDVSISAPLSSSGDSEGPSIESGLSDTAPSASSELEAREQAQLFQKALAEFKEMLGERDRMIFEQRLLSENPKTLLEIGELYGVSKERARQLEEAIKKKLKDFLAEKYPDIAVD